MRAAFKPAPVAMPDSPTIDRSKQVRWVGRLIIVYIVLLMIEGALRKWALPRFSNPLLVVRDPVLILIYIMAVRARVFPRNAWVISLGVIGVLSLLLSLYPLFSYIRLWQLWVMVFYGFRSNFLHLPLIFLIPAVFDSGDVKRIGWWVLLGMIPLGLLMTAQFKAGPDSWINITAGGEGATQLETAGGKIRPPGTFSFISGPIYYSAMATAFWIYGMLARGTYRVWLLIPSGLALLLAVGVSGSRACVLAVLVVMAGLLVILVLRPAAVNQLGRFVLVGLLTIFIIARLPVFKEGVNVLAERFVSTTEMQETTVAGGLFERVFGAFTEGLTHIGKIPAAGWGLGIGTNVGAHFLLGAPAFILSENEWTRVLCESGPILGLAFLLWRTLVTLRLGWLSILALRRHGSTLPILLFSSGFYVLLSGQLGQATTLGFAVVLCGLCLAAMQPTQARATERELPPIELPPPASAAAPRPLPRSSPFATRLHGRAADPNNGLTDR